MNSRTPLALLGGLSPSQFMQRHWQKKPLLVRQAVPGFQSPLSVQDLKALAGQDDVESRLIVKKGPNWRMRQGPLSARSFPARSLREWTFLVQGVNLHDDRISDFMRQFRFVPDARLDDLMISWATDGGGVGPHFDSYDVFLFQAQGRRRWRIGRTDDLELQPGLPLKILRRFKPEAEFVLEPGDMLYLPPGSSRLVRVHASYVSEAETNRVVDFWKQQAEPEYDKTFLMAPPSDDEEGQEEFDGPEDPVYEEAVRVVLEMGKASTSTLQRRLRLGYGRAARILDMMQREGIIGPPDGSRPRDVLKSPDWLREVDEQLR